MVRPGERRFAVGWDNKNGRLKVSLTEEAERGRANAELVSGLSRALCAPVEIARGERGRRKLLRIGLEAAEIQRRVVALPEGR